MMIDCAECNTPFYATPSAIAKGKKYCSAHCRVRAVARGNVRPLEERFWEKVDRKGADECWPWTAGTFADGYGAISVDGKPRRAPRVAYELVNGPILDGLELLHSCDNPICVNPEHLSPGTHAENMADMAKKGRAGGFRKLSDAQVGEIRALSMPLKEISAAYGVSIGLVALIRGKSGYRT